MMVGIVGIDQMKLSKLPIPQAWLRCRGALHCVAVRIFLGAQSVKSDVKARVGLRFE